MNRDVIFFCKMGLLLTSVKTSLSGSCNTLIDCIQIPYLTSLQTDNIMVSTFC